MIKPKMLQLMALGGACLLYAVLVSFVLNSDLQGLAAFAQNKEQMTESQMMAFMQKVLPVFFKMLFLSIPLLMATWFSPMLIAFNNYSLLKAIKSSIAGSLQYMVALVTTWLLMTAGIVVFAILISIFAAILGVVKAGITSLLGPIVIFGILLSATALMLAFQYVSYRDVFRAA